MLIFIVRHGQTNWNLEDRFQGRSDIPLNETGERQARQAGEALSGLGIARIVTSPLLRAQRTGRLIAGVAGISTFSTDERLVERDLGSYEGLTIASRPDYFLRLDADDGSMEPLTEVGARMCAALLAMRGTGPVAAVSHGAAINALLFTVSGGAVGTGITRLDNGCISVLCSDEANTRLTLLAYNLLPERLSDWVKTAGAEALRTGAPCATIRS